VVVDNLPAHKVLGVEDAIEAVGASLSYLPQYSEFESLDLWRRERRGVRPPGYVPRMAHLPANQCA
jgi:hypothetical protein